MNKMQNAKCKMQNESRDFLHFAFCILHSAAERLRIVHDARATVDFLRVFAAIEDAR